MRNIHLLETHKSSKLGGSRYITNEQDNTALKLKLWDYPYSTEEFEDLGYMPIYVYITSKEEIKLGDWYSYCNQISKRIRKNPKAEYPYPNYQKIILTTDPSLISDSVQAIDDEFLEWLVKNPDCEEAVVESEFKEGNGSWKIWYRECWPYEKMGAPQFETRYKIIIPQENIK
jgi:hypothetical protein